MSFYELSAAWNFGSAGVFSCSVHISRDALSISMSVGGAQHTQMFRLLRLGAQSSICCFFSNRIFNEVFIK